MILVTWHNPSLCPSSIFCVGINVAHSGKNSHLLPCLPFHTTTDELGSVTALPLGDTHHLLPIFSFSFFLIVPFSSSLPNGHYAFLSIFISLSGPSSPNPLGLRSSLPPGRAWSRPPKAAFSHLCSPISGRRRVLAQAWKFPWTSIRHVQDSQALEGPRI